MDDWPRGYTTEDDPLWKVQNSLLPDSSSSDYRAGPDGWPDYINHECKDSLLTIFIFTQAQLAHNTWESLYKKQLYSKKYKLSVQDLERINWQVIYK
ncbi:hypothetical protein [Hymenobacter sp. BT730]|uniref:hypothetical protein n=1 Tax=Hymenobacter sp. BT730 TaxID=3063332 RepID=UPI0026E0EA21|nr:hypothetical protein [Hymenobacter sp. BT730]